MLAGPQTQSHASGTFPETQWTLVSRARQCDVASEMALEELCQQYWRPVYLYAMRSGFNSLDAEDLTQGFFAQALRLELFQKAESRRGRLRSLLLTAFQRHMVSEWRRETRQKRERRKNTWLDEAALQELSVPSHMTPQEAYDRAWILQVMQDIEHTLHRDYFLRGRGEVFKQLWPLLGWSGADMPPISAVAAACGMNPSAARTALHRLRAVCRRHLETVVGRTLENPADLDDEIRYLLTILGKDGAGME